MRFQNRVLIALALRGYLERGHRGFLMPCAYLRPNSVGRPVFLTMELRPVSTITILDPRVAVLGPDVLVTTPDPGSNFDSAWDFVARAGFSSLTHVPIAPGDLHADGALHTL